MRIFQAANGPAVGQRVCEELVTLAHGLPAVGLPGPPEAVGYYEEYI